MPPLATAGPGAAAHPCLRTHGKEVAWLHLLDWIVLLLLVAMYGVLSLVQPFHRFVAEDMMATLRYPMKDNTVPGWAVPVHSETSSSAEDHVLGFTHHINRWNYNNCISLDQ
jgi:diacylglycerol diphosphate phosphatase / phosphatidate phosphatase